MSRRILVVCTILLLSFIMGADTGSAKESNRYIGLHDKLLTFNPGEIQMHEGSMVVPLRKMANNLYAEMAGTADYIRIMKNGHEISYRYASGQTKYDGVVVTDSQPIAEIEGTLFISVRSMAEHFGFKVDYLSNIRTARIYSDSYKHLSHIEYAQLVAPIIAKWETPKPEEKPAKANVYLTFDDGPTASTLTNMNTLRKYDVYGTFFFIGNQMKAYPTTVKKVAEAGHFIGTHSMTHDQAKVYRSTQSFMDEMHQASDLVAQLTGNSSKLVRVPYGSVPHLTPTMRSQLKQAGYKVWDWDVDSDDWRYTTSQYTHIIQNVQKGVTQSYQAGDRNIVVLMHDHPQSAKALPSIIEWLQQEGYTLQKYDPANHVVQNFRNDPEL